MKVQGLLSVQLADYGDDLLTVALSVRWLFCISSCYHGLVNIEGDELVIQVSVRPPRSVGKVGR